MIDTYFNKISNTLERIDKESIQSIVGLIKDTVGTIFVFGNGGSSTTASHFTQDLIKGLGLKAICLNDNVASILAFGNDESFESVFLGQLITLAKEDDLVIGISCSGNSRNVIYAIEWATANNIRTIGLFGYDGGKLKELVDYPLHVPSSDMQVCEDCHLIVCHVIYKLLK